MYKRQAFNAAAVPDLLTPISDVFGSPAGAGLWNFAARIGAPLRLADLGLREPDLDRAADIALKNAYWNPRPFTRDDIRDLLQAAFEGRRPTS